MLNRNKTVGFRPWLLLPCVIAGGAACALLIEYISFAPEAWWGIAAIPILTLCATPMQWSSKELKQTRGKEEFQPFINDVFDSHTDGYIVTCSDGKVLLANQTAQRMSGMSAFYLHGKSVSLMYPRRYEYELRQRIKEVVDNAACWVGETQGIRADGTTYPQYLEMGVISKQGSTGLFNVAMKLRDLSDNNLNELQLAVSSKIDFLTGLPNRYAFGEKLAQALLEIKDNLIYAVLVIDIDRFKTINGSAGHPMGDRLLQVIGGRLQAILPAEKILARMGGDEFVIGISLPDRNDLSGLAETVQKSISEQCILDDYSFISTASIGVAVFPFDGVTADELIMRADMALFEAKAKGRSRIEMFSTEISRRIVQQNQLSICIRSASKDEFFMRYQPKVDMRTNELVGFEALLRWQHRDNQEMLPDTFISIAEDTGAITEIGQHVLSLVCKQLKRWGSFAKPVAINISAIQLKDPRFVSEFINTIDAYNVSRNLLEIEITESVLISNTAEVSKAITHLRSQGVRVALDDFGTGYSSLSYLTNFRLDSLKIDRSFVSKISTSKENEAVFQFLVDLSKCLGVTLIAEGVETAEQAKQLTEYGCCYGQGWFYGKPMLIKDATDLLMKAQDQGGSHCGQVE